MQDAIGIALLVGVAILLRFFFHAAVGVHLTVRVIPFNVIAFWVLLFLSLAWATLAGLLFVLRVHSS
jgi:hypothetical protein